MRKPEQKTAYSLALQVENYKNCRVIPQEINRHGNSHAISIKDPKSTYRGTADMDNRRKCKRNWMFYVIVVD